MAINVSSLQNSSVDNFLLFFTRKGGHKTVINLEKRIVEANLKSIKASSEVQNMISQGRKVSRFIFSTSAVEFDNGERIYFSTRFAPIQEIRKLFDQTIESQGVNPSRWPERAESNIFGRTLYGPDVAHFADETIPFLKNSRNTSGLTFSAKKQIAAACEFYYAMLKNLKNRKKTASLVEQKKLDKIIEQLFYVRMDFVEETLANPCKSKLFSDLLDLQKTLKKNLIAKLPIDPNKLFSTLFDRRIDVSPELEKKTEILSVRMALARINNHILYAKLLRDIIESCG